MSHQRSYAISYNRLSAIVYEELQIHYSRSRVSLLDMIKAAA